QRVCLPVRRGGTSENRPRGRRHALTPFDGEQQRISPHRHEDCKGIISQKRKRFPHAHRFAATRRGTFPSGSRRNDADDRAYLIVTFAPASSSFFLIVSASACGMFSLIGLGAPSTSSLASFRPRLVSSRTTLMTPIFLVASPTPSRTTVNSVLTSAGAGAGP